MSLSITFNKKPQIMTAHGIDKEISEPTTLVEDTPPRTPKTKKRKINTDNVNFGNCEIPNGIISNKQNEQSSFYLNKGVFPTLRLTFSPQKSDESGSDEDKSKNTSNKEETKKRKRKEKKPKNISDFFGQFPSDEKPDKGNSPGSKSTVTVA